MPSVSLIVNSYKRQNAVVMDCLNSILKNKTSLNFDIIVIDQNPSPEIFFKHSLVRVFHYPEKSISKARNFGVSKSEFDWVIFLDDDATIDTNYLQTFLNLINHYPQTFIFGGTIYLNEDHELFYSSRQNISEDKLAFYQLKAIMGGNFAIRRDVFHSLLGFDETLGIGVKLASSEDTDLIWNAYFHQCEIRISRQLKIYHPSPKLIDYNKSFEYGVGKGYLVKKWLFKNKKSLVFIELLEMLFVPLLKMIISPKNYKTYLGSLYGRVKGLFYEV